MSPSPPPPSPPTNRFFSICWWKLIVFELKKIVLVVVLFARNRSGTGPEQIQMDPKLNLLFCRSTKKLKSGNKLQKNGECKFILLMYYILIFIKVKIRQNRSTYYNYHTNRYNSKRSTRTYHPTKPLFSDPKELYENNLGCI